MLFTNQRIGLLGGSFNPAHEGHIHLSKEAMRSLQLDHILWLLTPQNPLKQKSDLADYDTRMSHAQTLTAPYPFITVSDFEKQHGLHYSIDTISALQQTYRRARFVWLMGADNLASFHRWHRWRDFFATIPMAIFDRAPFSHAALRQPAALSHAPFRIATKASPILADAVPPAWCYLFMPRHPLSATELRKTLGERAFL